MTTPADQVWIETVTVAENRKAPLTLTVEAETAREALDTPNDGADDPLYYLTQDVE